jgi:hypothetical protein
MAGWMRAGRRRNAFAVDNGDGDEAMRSERSFEFKRTLCQEKSEGGAREERRRRNET